MNMALIMTAVKYGATIANYAELRALNKDAAGKVTGAEVVDLMSGEKITVKAKVL
jgi:glycerol-3-phosphate dehydrogenase